MNSTSPTAGIRTWLYVPADSPRKLAAALRCDADALLVDLEDAVSPAAKEPARRAAAALLAAPSSKPLWVRVNSDADLVRDLDEVVGPSLSGICVPKASLDLVGRIEELLVPREQATQRGPIPLMALVETATGIVDAAHLARVPRVRILAIGEQDLAAELGVRPPATDDPALTPTMAMARAQLVVASAAAAIAPPVGPVPVAVEDPHLVEDTRRLRASGFGSRALIHPQQVAHAHAGLRPSAQEVADAHETVRAAERAGSSVSLDARGRMIDEPVLRQARSTIMAFERDRPAEMGG